MGIKRAIKKWTGVSALAGVVAVAVFATLSGLSTPVRAAVSKTGSMKVSLDVGTAIAMTITGNADGQDCPSGFMSCSTFGDMLPNNYGTAQSTVKVYTNAAEGYVLSVRSTTQNADMRTEGGDYIPAGVLTSESGGQGVWSYKTDSTGVKTSWTAMSTSDTQIKGTSVQSPGDPETKTGGNKTVVTYGLSTSNTQASGEYVTNLTYTATAPNQSTVYPTLAVNFGEGIAGAQIREGSLTGAPKGIVTTSGGTVRIDSSTDKKYYIVPMYQSGYTLASVTAGSTGTVTADSSAYGYYYYTSDGSAANTVTLSATALTAELTSTTLATLQDLTEATCPAIPTAYRDARDNSVYYVQRMIDGKCWMLENLRLAPGTTLTAASGLSNIASDFTLPASTTGAAWTNSYTDPYVNSDSITTTKTGYGAGRNYVGVYYNYAAASAGTINAAGGSNLNDDTYNICPANWTFPSGGTSGWYRSLGELLAGRTLPEAGYFSGGDATVIRNVLSTPLSGYFYDGSAHSQGSGGYFWSTTRLSGSTMYLLYVNSSIVGPQNNDNRYLGFSVRCVRQ